MGGAILKFYNAGHASHTPAMASIEAAAYLAQATAAGSPAGSGGMGSGCNSGSSGPRLLGAGVLTGCRDGSMGDKPRGAAAAAAAETGAVPAANEGQQAAAAPPPPLPFLAIQKAEGVTLGSCMEALSKQQLLAVAAAAGRSLAAFHAMPLPAAAAGHAGQCGCNANGSLDSGSGSRCSRSACTAWVARDGLVYSSAAGTLDIRGEEGASAEEAAAAVWQRQQQCLRLFPSAAAALGQGAAVAEPAAVAESANSPGRGGSACHMRSSSCCAACSAWQPFLLFLRRQRRHAAKAHRREGSLPPQLQQQVESYLPADPAVLVGHGSCACCSAAPEGTASQPANGSAALGSPAGTCGGSSCGGSSNATACINRLPTWVHGDLTAENLLLSSALLAGTPQQTGQQPTPGNGETSGSRSGGSSGVTLIDFADSGQGDPLWDFVPLLLRSLRCDWLCTCGMVAQCSWYGAVLLLCMLRRNNAA